MQNIVLDTNSLIMSLSSKIEFPKLTVVNIDESLKVLQNNDW